jgi:hypothetical protein
MSRQTKNRKHRATAKSAKGHNAGADKHFSPGMARSHYPHLQPAPCWVKSSGKRGWWNKKGVRHETQSNA